MSVCEEMCACTSEGENKDITEEDQLSLKGDKTEQSKKWWIEWRYHIKRLDWDIE